MSKKQFTPKIIVVLGPTASGKSDLAVKLAKRFHGEIISADSRQVYKGLDIGTGKVPRDRYIDVGRQYIHKGVIHHLLDVASPKKVFTVVDYQKLGRKAIEKILKKDKLPIICGGTGFYIDALIHEWKLPAVPPRKKLRKKLEKKSAAELFQMLSGLDPTRAKNIDRHNRVRLIRALEIVITTGAPVPPQHSNILKNVGMFQDSDKNKILKIGVRKSPMKLKKLIAERLEKRLKQGLIKEVKNLHRRGLSWRRLDNLGLEYRYVSRYLRGLMKYDEMVEELKKTIRRYAKRQMTWFKRDKKIKWVKSEKKALRLALKFTKNY